MKLRTRIVCHRPLLLMSLFTNLSRSILARLILTALILPIVSGSVFGLSFSVTTKVDRRGPALDTSFSQDAKYHVSGRFIRLTEDISPGSFVGELCCQRQGESAEDYFVRSKFDNRPLLLRVNSRPYRDGSSLRPTRAIVYEINGELAAQKELFFSQGSTSLISVARSKTLVGILNANRLQVFDTDLELVTELELPELVDPLSFELSVDGSSVVFFGSKKTLIANLETGEITHLTSCVFSHERAGVKVRADEREPNKYMLLNSSGELCIVNGASEQQFSVNISGEVIDAYMDRDVLFVVTPLYLYAFDGASGKTIEQFDGVEFLGQADEQLAPFGSPIYGIKNSVEYDPETCTLYSRGSKDHRTFFEIRLIDYERGR